MNARKTSGDVLADMYIREMDSVRLTEERKRQLALSLGKALESDGEAASSGGEGADRPPLRSAKTPYFAEAVPANGGRSSHFRKVRRTAVFLAAAFIVLCGFVTARYGQEVWREWFGTDAAADRLESVSAAADYGSVHMEVPSVVADANGLYLLLQIRDAEGRIDGPVDLFSVGTWVNGENPSSEEQMVSFDEGTGTANVVLKIDGEFPVGAEGEVTLTNIRDAPRNQECSVDIGSLAAVPDVGASAFAKRPDRSDSLPLDQLEGLIEWSASMPEPGDDASVQELFVAQTMEAPIAGDERLSVVGAGYRDGELHVLVRNKAEGLTFAQLLLRSQESGEWLWPAFGIDYCYGEDWPVREVRPDDVYEVPEKMYSDFTFKVDKEDLADYDLWAQVTLADWEICGQWKATFTVPEISPSDVLTASAAVPDEVLGTIDRVTVTPFSVGLHGEHLVEWTDFAPEVAFAYRDGAVRPYSGIFDSYSQTSEELAEDSSAATLSAIGKIEDFEEIVAIEVNGARINLKD